MLSLYKPILLVKLFFLALSHGNIDCLGAESWIFYFFSVTTFLDWLVTSAVHNSDDTSSTNKAENLTYFVILALFWPPIYLEMNCERKNELKIRYEICPFKKKLYKNIGRYLKVLR